MNPTDRVHVHMKPTDVIYGAYGATTNFLTPMVLGYGWIVDDMVAYELSQGTGIGGDSLFGVSIAAIKGDGRSLKWPEMSGCFPSRAEADGHIVDLRKRLAY